MRQLIPIFAAAILALLYSDLGTCGEAGPRANREGWACEEGRGKNILGRKEVSESCPTRFGWIA